MNNILQQIVATKQKEVEALRSSFVRNDVHTERPCISLVQRLLADESTGIIAEFKRRSPSKGWFTQPGQNVSPVVSAYEAIGAAGASILTDETYFGGSREDILTARNISSLPLLRKDFIIDEIQLHEAKAIGADVVLLIAAILTPQQTEALASLAKQLGMEVLLEIHEEIELDHINNSIDMVGVNNRNLKTFVTDIDTSFQLINKIPNDKIAVAESGITDVDTIRALRNAGFKGFLIGEHFMKADDPALCFQQFVHQLKQGV